MDLQVNWPVSFPALVRWLLRNATELAVFSHSIKQNLLRSGVPEETVQFMPHGMDISFSHPKAEPSRG